MPRHWVHWVIRPHWASPASTATWKMTFPRMTSVLSAAPATWLGCTARSTKNSRRCSTWHQTPTDTSLTARPATAVLSIRWSTEILDRLRLIYNLRRPPLASDVTSEDETSYTCFLARRAIRPLRTTGRIPIAVRLQRCQSETSRATFSFHSGRGISGGASGRA
jgi:hypothetical protein